MDSGDAKPLFWVASSKAAMKRLPAEVQDEFGFALFQAQCGAKHVAAKPLKGFGGAGVLEIVDDYDGDTFRTVYTVKFARAVYVLHVFQKKSKRGIRTPVHDLELIRSRLALAAADYQKRSDQDEPFRE